MGVRYAALILLPGTPTLLGGFRVLVHGSLLRGFRGLGHGSPDCSPPTVRLLSFHAARVSHLEQLVSRLKLDVPGTVALLVELHESEKESEKKLHESEKESEKKLHESEKESEKKLLEQEWRTKMQASEAFLKEKSRVLMQRMLYEKFLTDCWEEVKSVNEAAYTSARALISEPSSRPPKDRANDPKKTSVDLLMRTNHPDIENIHKKILGKCNPPPAFISNTREYTHGYLSNAIHFPGGKDMFVRDDEPDDFKKFFVCLAQIYDFTTEVLDPRLISLHRDCKALSLGATAEPLTVEHDSPASECRGGEEGRP